MTLPLPNTIFEHYQRLASQWTVDMSDEQLDDLCQQAGDVERAANGSQHIWALAQINPTPGHCDSNGAQLLSQYRLAAAMQLGGVLSPELSLMGYPISDAVIRFPAIVDHQLDLLAELATQTGETALCVGFVEPVAGLPANKAHQPYYNSLAVCQQGTIQGVVRKRLLPAYNEYYDPRIFRVPTDDQPLIAPWQHGRGLPVVENWQPVINGVHVGLHVCYDWWHTDGMVEANPLDGWMAAYPDTQVLLNASASPSRLGKLHTREDVLARLIHRYHKPLLYCNQVGGVDEHVFDGASMAIDGNGDLRARGPAFAPAMMLVSLFEPEADNSSASSIAPHPEAMPDNQHLAAYPADGFDELHRLDCHRTYDALVLGVRDYFKKTGFKRSLLGLSGGLDSSITAAIATEALGADNVLGVLMPSALTSEASEQDARQLASNLAMPVIQLPIDAFERAATQQRQTANTALLTHWGSPASQHFADDNQQAMSRAMLLRLLGNEYQALPLATSDKSELYLGYATVNGDMSGGLAPLGDVVKTKVRALGYWINQHKGHKGHKMQEVIPEMIMQKPPGAELAMDPATGKPLTAEDALMPYAFADEVIWRMEYHHQWPLDMVNEPFAYEATHSITPEQKQAWLEKFLHRMQRAVFKWWVAPPILIVDGEGGADPSCLSASHCR
jgi:NAD+ synthetase